MIDQHDNIKVALVTILERCLVPRNNESIVQWLVEWLNLPASKVTWGMQLLLGRFFSTIHP